MLAPKWSCKDECTDCARFPPIPDPSAALMNWAILLFGVIALFSGTYYAVAGRKTFNPPIRKDEYLR